MSLWGRPVQVQAGESVEGAVVLDDYAGKERVFFLLSEAPVGQNAVDQAVRSVFDRPLADLDTLPGIDATQRSVLIVRTAE